MSSAFKNVLMHCSVCVFAEVALVYPLAASRHEGAAFSIAVLKKKESLCIFECSLYII